MLKYSLHHYIGFPINNAYATFNKLFMNGNDSKTYFGVFSVEMSEEDSPLSCCDLEGKQNVIV